MTETLNHCIICDSAAIEQLHRCQDHFVTGEFFNISVCRECGFYFTNPRPTEADVGRYYASEEYVSHSKTSTGLVNRLFHIARYFTIRHKEKIVRKNTSSKSILDYGCGTGDFLAALKKSGWSCYGIEPNESARLYAKESNGIHAGDENSFGKIEDASLSAISLWHVLEHVYPIEQRLKDFHQKLTDEGTLFVAVPNMKSFDAKKYGSFWAAYDVPRHIYHFSPATLEQLMKRSGFTLVKKYPMRFDAIYISMLSEKYKTGTSKILKALYFGLLSNFLAFFKGGNYSSLIYIFKKS